MKKILLVALGVVFGVVLVVVALGVYRFDVTDDDIFVEQSDGSVVPYADINSDGQRAAAIAPGSTQQPAQAAQDEGYVIETEVEGPEDCTPVEQYDAARKVCFVECDTPAACDAVEAQIDAALEALDADYQTFSKDFTEFDGDAADLERNAEVIYAVREGEQFVVVSGKEQPRDATITKWLAAISPDAFADRFLDRLIIVRTMADDAAAFVMPSANTPQKWDMYVNAASLREDGEKEMVFTLIHEFAHILTLNNTQLYDASPAECKTYFTGEGCLHSNAYLNAFYQRFWKGQFDVEAADPEDLYAQQPDAFVTPYAASNPGEDIAESFAAFVLRKQPAHANTLAEQKLQFFFDYPELRELRTSIRSALAPFVRKRIVR